MDRKIADFMDILNIPDDERDFVLGLDTELPEKYRNLKKKFTDLGVTFEIFERDKLPFTPFEKFDDEAKGRIEKTERFFVITIPESAEIDEPMPICCFTEIPAPGNHHLNLKVGANARATVVIGSTVPRLHGDPEVLSNLEVSIGENAILNLVILNSFRKNQKVKPLVRGFAGDNSKVRINVLNLTNGALHSSDYRFSAGSRVDFNLNVISFARNSDRIEDSYRINLEGKKSNALLNIRGISRDGSYQRHIAVIEAGPESHGSTGIADTAGYLLQDESRFEVWPSLIVKNDDIHLDHQAYVGHIPEEIIEYLRSRGFRRELAMFLIVHSMIEPLKKDLPERFQREIEVIARLLVENRLPEI